MSDDPDHTRRWLINASGAAILSNALAGRPSYAQVSATPAAKAAQGGLFLLDCTHVAASETSKCV